MRLWIRRSRSNHAPVTNVQDFSEYVKNATRLPATAGATLRGSGTVNAQTLIGDANTQTLIGDVVNAQT